LPPTERDGRQRWVSGNQDGQPTVMADRTDVPMRTVGEAMLRH
jgi:hypothetical protein